MPNKETHAKATVIGAIGSFPVAWSLGATLAEAAAISAGFLATLMINPDLDVNSRFPRRSPSKWIPWLIFLPYAKFINHRSPLSHMPVVGTLFRLVYLGILMAVIIRVLGISAEIVYGPFQWIFIGMVISDMIHFFMDVVS